MFDGTNGEIVFNEKGKALVMNLKPNYLLIKNHKHQRVILQGCIAYGVGALSELKATQGQLSIYKDEEIEYFYHQYLGLYDISYLIGLRVDMRKLKGYIEAYYLNEGPCYKKMWDGTKLYRLAYL